MPRKSKKNNAGRKPTGLKRTIMVPLMLDEAEWEHLKRLEAELGLKMVRVIRLRVFLYGELERLRQAQGANIPPMKGVRT